MNYRNSNAAYITGVAIGDGNLSPADRTVRLRISCDNKYPLLINRIRNCLQDIFKNNTVSLVKRRKNCTDISVYSNELEDFLGWKAKNGSKFIQDVRVPSWIFYKRDHIKNCLRGLFETDGSVYKDRQYIYANFTTIIHGLSQDVQIMIDSLGYSSTTQSSLQKTGRRKFVTRVCKNSRLFINDIGIRKE